MVWSVRTGKRFAVAVGMSLLMAFAALAAVTGNWRFLWDAFPSPAISMGTAYLAAQAYRRQG